MKRSVNDVLGLYKVQVWLNKKSAGTIKVFAYDRRSAYYEVMHTLPKHNSFDSTRIRDAKENEKLGVKMEKNDLKRKQ